MAYVRKKGNQLAIVHGQRHPDSGSVTQETLFTIFSKAEAYRAIGKGSKDQSYYFQNLLQDEFPEIKFNWESINKGIADNLDVLPDLAEYREQRLISNFKEGLHSFTREIVQSDPQSLLPSAKVLFEHKEQLEFLRDVIDMKLETIDTVENAFNGDNEFYWRQALHGWGINGDVEEMASELYRAGEYDSAASAFTLLTESFPNYAEGHNYLGLIHLDMGQLEKSVLHFKKTVELGRKMFPKRHRKDHYWVDHKTRPYIRGLRNLALALNRNGSYEEALSYCDILEKECGDETTAACHRASIFLNLGKWELAETNAVKMIDISPLEAIVAAFAQFELGKFQESRSHFLYAAFNSPLAVQILVKGRAKMPEEFLEVEDYNSGIETRAAIAAYLSQQSTKFRKFFSSILKNPEVAKLTNEASECAANHSRIKDQDKHRNNFQRWHEIKELKFAQQLADLLE